MDNSQQPADDGKSNFLFLTQTPKSFTGRRSIADRKLRTDKAKNAHVQQGYWKSKKDESARKLKWKRAVLVRDERGLRLSSKSKSRSPVLVPTEAEPLRHGHERDLQQRKAILDPSQPGPTPPSPKMRYGGAARPRGFIIDEEPVAPIPGSLHRIPANELKRLYWSAPPEEDLPSVKTSATRWAYQSDSPSTALDTSLIDPFVTGTFPISKSMNSDIKHCATFLFPSIYQFEIQMKSSIRIWLEQVFAHPVMLYSALSVTLLHRRAVMSFPVFANLTAGIDRQFLYYKGMAIKEINKALLDPQEAFRPSTIWAIISMLAVETMMGSEQEMLAHRLGLLRILNLRGGLHGLPTPMIDSLIPTLHWASYWTKLKPQYPPPLSGKPLSIETSRRVLAAVPGTPYEHCLTGLETPEVDPLMSPALKGVVQDIRENIFFRENHQGGGWGASLPEIEYINYTAHQCRHVLLSFDHEDFDSPIQESISIALATFTAATDEFFDSASPVCRALIPRLKGSLQCSDLRFFWNPAHRALVWVMSVGAFQSSGQPERPWFILQLARGLMLLDIRTLADLKWLLMGFAYLDRLYAVAIEQVWQEVEMMREALPNQWHP